MDVNSLGFRTDLALLALGGSEIEDREDYLVVRTPHNPTFWWGNFLLLSRVPAPSDADRWLDRFAAEFPGTAHVALGFDGVDGRVESLAAFVERGLKTEASTVMTATAIREPPRPNRDATYRQLSSDADWAQSVELNAVCNHEDEEEIGHRKFVERKVATNRAMVEAGHGGWFGGFFDGQLVSQLGLLSASPGLARFQWVETHPEARGRGLAGTLVHHAATYGFDQLLASTLVMVADPDYLAVRVYRSVGFSDGQTQLQASKPPPIG
jgi:ribosomal protein S18 acetylase RimI-like enzyme